MKVDEIIKKLKALDLSTYPVDEIRSLLNSLGQAGHIVVTYHRGKSIIRVRPNSKFQRFNYVEQLSYKPQKYNTTYQRASTPHKTMFYGCAVADKPTEGELNNPRAIAPFEAVKWLRDKSKKGYQKITYSRWIVKKDLNLLAIVFKESYYEQNSFTKELVDAYKDIFKSLPAEMIENSMKIQDFLAAEFSKEDTDNDYEYLISALFAEMCVQKGFDGVFYPSVRVGGMGFNIAITPQATSKLRLYAAGESSVYKLYDHTVIGNESILKYKGNRSKIKYKRIKSHRKECLTQLGLNSIEELLT
jgi:hypothetical protein